MSRRSLHAMVRDQAYRRLLLTTLPVIVVCGLMSMAGQRIATRLGAGQPPARDILVDILPATDVFGFVVWGPVVFTAFLTWVLLRNAQYLPFTVKTIALTFAVRACFMVLTPLGVRPDVVDPGYDGLLRMFVYDHSTNDFFFSGHTAYPFVCALIFWEQPRLRWTFLVVSALFGVSVLLGHAHYSIDVFAVPFMAGGVLWWAKKIFVSDHAYITSLTPADPSSSNDA